MIWNYDHFLRWNDKFAHFWKYVYIQKLKHNMWQIETTLNVFNNKLPKEKTYSKISFYELSKGGQKDLPSLDLVTWVTPFNAIGPILCLNVVLR